MTSARLGRWAGMDHARLRSTAVAAAIVAVASVLAPAAFTASAAAVPAARESGRVYHVATDSLRVRSEPSTAAPVLGLAHRGDALADLDEYRDGWHLVRVQATAVTGWVHERYIDTHPAATELL